MMNYLTRSGIKDKGKEVTQKIYKDITTNLIFMRVRVPQEIIDEISTTN